MPNVIGDFVSNAGMWWVIHQCLSEGGRRAGRKLGNMACLLQSKEWSDLKFTEQTNNSHMVGGVEINTSFKERTLFILKPTHTKIISY